MNALTLNMAYTPAASPAARRPGLRLRLEPEYVASWRNRPDVGSLATMLTMARGGISTWNVMRKCRWAKWDRWVRGDGDDDHDLVVTLGLWVWPSDIELEYSLDLPPGVTASEPELVREPRETNIWVSGAAGEFELPWLLEDAEFSWHPRIGLWDDFGAPADPPEIVPLYRGGRGTALVELRGGRGVYGVMRARGTAVGWRHAVVIRYPVGGNGDPEAPAIHVTHADDVDALATWTDENGETQTDETVLTIPDCVRAMLERCPEGTEREGSIRVEPVGEDGPVVVWYNSCNGRVLKIARGAS